ncbi:hypothetical protein [Aquimarina sp. 2201CG5-10]|uniref:hypothetical protein n=1 Tax=Aquimarina callyspongiae TaxID=3098150 RepID=UPI002AB51B84|nr:hypothetical protein [Aquimarina sp. 2201CG5-10]MDY8135836.1 hypothetical protein [Aquimarina sp. 2201CG5-10]
MNKKLIIILVLLFSTRGFIQAQVETSNSFRIDADSNLKTNELGLSKSLITPNPDRQFNFYKSIRDSLKLYPEKKPFSMINDNGLLSPQAQATPKWFKKDKEIREEYKSDQYLGDFKSGGLFVQLVYRDHEYVDGDLVRIYVNDDVIRSNVFLGASFEGIKINLVKGFNKIDIEALNQGTSGPNTAEFHLYDDQGNIITANEWNLTTGVKATLIVIKE